MQGSCARTARPRGATVWLGRGAAAPACMSPCVHVPPRPECHPLCARPALFAACVADHTGVSLTGSAMCSGWAAALRERGCAARVAPWLVAPVGFTNIHHQSPQRGAPRLAPALFNHPRFHERHAIQCLGFAHPLPLLAPRTAPGPCQCRLETMPRAARHSTSRPSPAQHHAAHSKQHTHARTHAHACMYTCVRAATVQARHAPPQLKQGAWAARPRPAEQQGGVSPLQFVGPTRPRPHFSTWHLPQCYTTHAINNGQAP